MLVLCVMYALYLRLLIPMAGCFDLATEVVGTICDIASLICGVIVAVTSPTHVDTL